MEAVTLSTGARVSGRPEHVARAVGIDQRMRGEESTWVAGLRAQSVKAAHPDDGWVDRDRNRIHLAYPQFNDGLAVGDLLALGWPWRADEVRVVRVTGFSALGPLCPPGFDNEHWYVHFEKT